MADKIIVVEPDQETGQRLVELLTGAGYEVSTQYSGGMKAMLAFQPDLLVLGADPPNLDCCDLLSAIKGSDETNAIRVVMLAHGGPPDRSRGFDLGADDVLSLPFDPGELLARVRAQLRDKHLEDELRRRVQSAEQSRGSAQEVVQAVWQNRRAFRAGLGLALLVLALAAGSTFVFLRQAQKETTSVNAAVAKLQARAANEYELMERSRKAREAIDQTKVLSVEEKVAALEQERQQLQSRLARAEAGDVAALQRQLNQTEGRVRKLESEERAAEKIIQSSARSVCLLNVVVGFRDRGSGSRLHYAAVNAQGRPVTDGSGNPLLSVTGTGPEVHLSAFGTGFLSTQRGQILTNHHVVEPWWQDDDVGELIKQGFEPTIVEMTAYFPGVPRGMPVTVERISSQADVAVVKGVLLDPAIKPLTLDDSAEAAVSGRAVLLLGYPTALEGILARAGDKTVNEIAVSSKGDSKQWMAELARRGLISPINTQGHIGDVLPEKIVYDAQTTSGGSGGPLLNGDGRVIGINFAILREFGGSNFAIPARFAKALLAQKP